MLTDAQKKAVNTYQKVNLEIVSFRVKKGKRAAYNEVSKQQGVSLSQMLENYLDNECRAVGINPDNYIVKKGGDNK